MWLLAKLRANQGLGLNIVMLKVTGLWSPTGEAYKKSHYNLRDTSIVLFIVLFLLIYIIMVPLGAFNSRDDLVGLVDGIGISFGGFTATLKLACFFFNSSSIKNLTSRVASLSVRANTADKKSEERQNIANNTQKWINVFVVIACTYIVMIEVATISRQYSMFVIRKHFSRLWFVIDPYESPEYEIVFFVTTVAICLNIVIPPVVDCFVAALLVATIGQLQLLRLDMTRITEDAVDIVRQRNENCEIEIGESSSMTQGGTVEENVDVEKTEVDEERTRLMGECVSRYHECVKIVRDFEASFGAILIPVVSGTVVILMVGIIFATTDPVASLGMMDEAQLEKYRLLHRNAVMTSVTFAFIVSAEFAAFCYMANTISEESELVRDSVYNCDWFDATEGFKRSMRIIMSCCNQPLVIKVAAFIPLTMETFLRTMNLAYSYYAALESTAF